MSTDHAALAGSMPLPRPTEAFDRHSSHVVQFYRDDVPLIEELSRTVGTWLVSGDAAIVIATEAHRKALARELKARGFDVSRPFREGRYASLDAAEVLSQFMVDGMPDRQRFIRRIGGAITRARAACKSDQRHIVAFGEMVALLWADGKQEAAIRLEELWNELAKEHSFSLRCAYPLNGFYKNEHGDLFKRICAEHSAVIPDDKYMLLVSDDDRHRHIATLQQRLLSLENERALRESEQRFRLLVEAVQDYAIFMLDPEGRVSSWNAGAQRIKGYQASEIMGKHFSAFYSDEDREAGKPQRALEIAARDGRVEDEGWRVRKDGSKFWANVVVTALREPAGKLVGFSKVTRDITEHMHAERALEESQRKIHDSEMSLRRLSLHLLRTQDEERRRIGRDLHDTLGQNLSVLKMKLESLRSATVQNQAAKAEELAECAQIASDCVKEVRTLSYLLYPPMLEELGLKSAIPWYLEGFTKRSGIQTTFEISPDFRRLPTEVESALFRVLQESLTNVHRHSGSPTADIRLLVNGQVTLEIMDKGKRADRKNFEQSGQDCSGALGVGVRGMCERMRQLGGKLELFFTSEGTTVTATVPVPESQPRP